MRCLIKRCPNGFEVCCQTCEASEFCKSKCSIKRPCQAQLSTKLEELEIKPQKKDKPYQLILWAVMLIIATVILVKIDSVEIAQTDTLNTLNATRLEIDDLKSETVQVDTLVDESEINGTRGDYERTDTYIGDFTITYYCGCEKCCGKTDKITKLGTTAEAGRTVGADWNVLQPGTKIYIEGIGERVVEDTGGGIQGNHIDVYIDSHDQALKLGKATRKVYEVM